MTMANNIYLSYI